MSGRMCNPLNVHGILNYNELRTPKSLEMNAAHNTALTGVSYKSDCEVLN